MTDKDKKAIVERIGIIRYNANLSARELSLRIGKEESYISTLEQKCVCPSMNALYDILEVCGVTPEQFFYENFKDYELDKKYLDIIKNMKSDKKQALIEFLMK